MASNKLQGAAAPTSIFNSERFHIPADVPAEEALQAASAFLEHAVRMSLELRSTDQENLACALTTEVGLAKSLIDAARQQPTEEAAPRALYGDDLEAVRRVFDVSPGEVLYPARRAVEALGWLGVLLHSIRSMTEKDTPSTVAIGKMAEMGEYVAIDAGNYSDVELEKLDAALTRAKGGEL